LEESIDGVINSDVEHISCYSLELDNNSRWGKLYKLGKFDETSDELNRKMYWYAVKEFAQNGFEQYEISNFSKPGLHSNHNFNFWMGQEYIGFGAGAHSYFGQKRYHNIRNLHKYTIHPTESSVIDEISEVNNQIFEFILLRLRLINIGIDINEFEEKFGETK
jgi:oxygen-independent coproporphyrinogen III oxidase